MGTVTLHMLLIGCRIISGQAGPFIASYQVTTPNLDIILEGSSLLQRPAGAIRN